MTTHPKYGENVTDVEVHAQGLGQLVSGAEGRWKGVPGVYCMQCTLISMEYRINNVLH